MGFQRTQFFAPGGIGWQDGKARAWLIEEYKKEKTKDGLNDSRLMYNIFYKQAYVDFPQAAANDTLVYGRKWIIRIGETKHSSKVFYLLLPRQGRLSRTNNFRFIRYADVLLLYAECPERRRPNYAAYTYVQHGARAA